LWQGHLNAPSAVASTKQPRWGQTTLKALT
jgi:hypothetical protein